MPFSRAFEHFLSPLRFCSPAVVISLAQANSQQLSAGSDVSYVSRTDTGNSGGGSRDRSETSQLLHRLSGPGPRLQHKPPQTRLGFRQKQAALGGEEGSERARGFSKFQAQQNPFINYRGTACRTPVCRTDGSTAAVVGALLVARSSWRPPRGALLVARSAGAPGTSGAVNGQPNRRDVFVLWTLL